MVIFNSYVELPEDEWFLSGVIYCNLCVCACVLKWFTSPKWLWLVVLTILKNMKVNGKDDNI